MTDHISLQSGTELVGDYRINRVLGAGGFGITYLADELALDRRVTIKEYFPSDFAARSDGSEAVPKSLDCSSDYRWGLDRFIDEAQTLAKFDHPNIVRVYRYFKANNTAYMVLHFEEGQSLKSWLKGLKRAPRQKELDAIVPKILEALHLIHEADFLHRDIAPDNIIIRKSGHPVLIDFGSARGEIASHSKTVSALVKPGYSPYEQYAETSSQQGPWTDIYALAATLYHAVTGKRPPDAPSRMVSDAFVPAHEAAIGAYRKGFLNAIDTALQLKIEDRPKSVAAWQRRLMAPDPARRGWRDVITKNHVGGDQKPKHPAKKKPDADARKQSTPTSAAATPAAGKAPERAGGLIEFLDGLKSRPLSPAKPPAKKIAAKSPVKKQATPKAKPKAPKAAVAKPKRSERFRLSTLWNRIGTSPNPIKVKAGAANERGDQARPVPTPKPPRPRRLPKRKHATLRPALMKLVIGVSAASAIVALQDRFPWPNKTSATTAPLTTASIRRTKPKAAPTPEKERRTHAFLGHSNAVRASAFADDGRLLLTAGEDSSLKIWDVESGKPVRTIILPHGQALSIAAREERALTSHRNGNVLLWDLSTGRQLAVFKRNDAQVWSVSFLADNTQFAAASHDWKTAIWSTEDTDAPLHIIEGHKNSVQSVAYAQTPRGAVIATASADKTIKFWNASSYKLVRTYRGHRDFVNHLAFSADGKRMASASIDGNIRIWSTTRRRLFRSLKDPAGSLVGLGFLNGTDALITAGKSKVIRFWNVKRRRDVRTLETTSGKLTALAVLTKHGRFAAGDRGGEIELWASTRASQISAR